MMKESDLTARIQQKLADFDNIGSIQPTEEWSRSLYSRLGNRKQSGRLSGTPGLLLVIVFMVLINLGFILNSFLNKSENLANHSSDMEVLSNELLISPTSLNQ